MDSPILVADDDPNICRLLKMLLSQWGYTVLVVEDGQAASNLLLRPDGPKMAILDWEIPLVKGPEICRQLRESNPDSSAYLIMLTSRDQKSDLISALESGADDFLVKPFERAELKARIGVGMRILHLQESLEHRICELNDSLKKIDQLRRLIPICAYCKKVRDDQNYWQEVDQFIASQSDIKFTHGICPDCLDKLTEE